MPTKNIYQLQDELPQFPNLCDKCPRDSSCQKCPVMISYVKLSADIRNDEEKNELARELGLKVGKRRKEIK